MDRNPYRSSSSTVVPRTLTELFSPGKDLEAEDALRLTYRVLPWKRIIVTIHVRPEPTLGAWVEKLSSQRGVEIFVEKSESLPCAHFRVVRSYETRLARVGESFTEPLQALDGVIEARLRVESRISFALGRGELRFFVSSYDATELATKFERAFPWDALGLPPLLGRTWSMQP